MSYARVLFLGFAVLLFAALVSPAYALNVREVRANNGLSAWLVEDKSLPILRMQMAWRGGVADESADEAGLSALMAGLLTEGAGVYDAAEFQGRLAKRAAFLRFSAGFDALSGTLSCLTPYYSDCFHLLQMALSEPNFEQAAIARVRLQLEAQLNAYEEDAYRLARNNLHALVFGAHRYGRAPEGDAAILARLTRKQIQARKKALMARDNLVIAVVGNISAETLRAVLDSVFRDLPEHAALGEVAHKKIDAPNEAIHVERADAQTTLFFGQQGVALDDEEFFAAYLANHILGSGQFSSRLIDVVRKQNGLIYGGYSALQPHDYGNLWLGYIASRHENVARAMALVRQEMADMAAGNISEAELATAKDYLTGAYALRFDSGAKITRELLGMQLQNRSIDYFATRNERLRAVSLDEVRAAARRLFKPDALFVSSVGVR